MKEKRRGSLWTGLVAGLVGLAGVAGWASPAGAVCADLNNDGKITIADAVRLVQAVGVAPNPADCGGAGSLACGDLNANGGLDVADVVTLLATLNHNPTLFGLCKGPGNTIACSGGKATVSGNITTNQVWSNACPVYVDGLVFVQSGVTVTINPGTTVVGKDPPSGGTGGPTNVSALIFQRGSKINAVGTQAQPIIMTSQDHFEHGTGGIGDWGGLTLNGAAPVNCPGGECLAEGLVGVPFGGNSPNDSSGKLVYVRVEFSGKELSPDNELNIITYNGVGRGTTVDHVQANVGFDDCQEWFGGTVDGKFLVDTGCGDDLHDTQLGTTGRFQFMLATWYRPYQQNIGSNHGFEWDNNENGFDLLPRNAPQICNVTIVGTRLQGGSPTTTNEFGSNLRRGTSGIVANAILEHLRSAGLKVSDNATAAQACVAGPALKPGGLIVEHSLLFDNGTDSGSPIQITGNWTTPCTPAQWYGLLPSIDPNDPTHLGSDPHLGGPGSGSASGNVIYGTANPSAQTDLNQFIPAGSAGTATQTVVNSLAMNCASIDATFFQNTNYIGAFKPGDPASNWLTAPWISFHLQ